MLLGLSILNKTWILLLISLSAIVTGIIGFYHTGIEQGWWSGPLGCSNQFGSETDISNLTTLLLKTPIVKCDEIVWSLFNISMAGWNSLVSFFVAILCGIEAPQRTQCNGRDYSPVTGPAFRGRHSVSRLTDWN